MPTVASCVWCGDVSRCNDAPPYGPCAACGHELGKTKAACACEKCERRRAAEREPPRVPPALL